MMFSHTSLFPSFMNIKNVCQVIHDMRIKQIKIIAFLVVFVNISLFYFSLRLFNYYHKIATGEITSTVYIENEPELELKLLSSNKISEKLISKLVTVVIREFETHANDVSSTVYSILKILRSIQIFILYDKIPYPPLELNSYNFSESNLKQWNLSPSLGKPTVQSPVSSINTKYVLFIPDATRVVSVHSIQKLLKKADDYKGSIIVSPVSGNRELECFRLNVNTKEWSLKYNIIKSFYCDAVNGKQIILLETELLKNLSNPFLLPFPSSLYIQTSSLNAKAFILNAGMFHEGNSKFRTHHAQWKLKQINQQRLKSLYKLFRIKLVVKEGKNEYYGCNRETPRCFEDVIDSIPVYLYENRWTPPCCLTHLRKTTKYILGLLDQFGMRYWLESGSLLGAVRSGDILPWDHDVDIGYINEDSNRCKWLQIAQNKSVIDNKGFFWEKVKEGNYFRVHFSKTNRIFVNLFPFSHKNGTMSRNLFFDSRKNMEFPDNFLHPMSSVEFIGRTVPCPNNVRDFLENKFGKGCIEKPDYPNRKMKKFRMN